MLRLFVVVIAFVSCEAGYDHSGGGSGLSYGGSSGHSYGDNSGGSLVPILTGGLSTFANTPIGGGHSSIPLTSNFGLGVGGLGGLRASPVHFAASLPQFPIHSQRSVELAPIVSAQQPSHPQVIEVNGDDQPVQVIFRSQGSRVFVQQVHTPGAAGHVETTRSEDEPHRVVHEVIRPVIQEVREVIQPYRRLTQEIRPVLEEVHTVVAKGEKKYENGLTTGHDYSGASLGGNGYKSKKA